MMIQVKLNVVLVDKARLFPGKNGAKYLDLVLFENKQGRDQYGNEGFVKQGQSKEDRAAKKQTPIIGNWRYIGQGAPAPTEPAAAPADNSEPPF